MGLFSMKKGCLREISSINKYKYLVRGNEEEAVRLFTLVPTEKTRGNGHKLKNMTFHLLLCALLEQWDWI